MEHEHEYIRELLLKYIDGETTTEESEKINEHLTSCKECQQEYKELKTVLSLFNTLEPMEPPEDLKKSIMAKIRNESLPKPWFSSIKSRWISWGATAAVIFIVIGAVSMSGLLDDSPDVAMDYRQAEIMPAGLGIEYGIEELSGVEENRALVDGYDDRRNFREGTTETVGIADGGRRLNIADIAGGESFQDVNNREVISLTVADIDASLGYIRNLLGDDTVVVREYEQEAIILAWTEKDEAQLIESLGELGVIEIEISPGAGPMKELNALEINGDRLVDDICESLESDEQNNRLPRDLESIEWQAADIGPLEIEDRVMYEIRISVQQE